jgi:hypothetical protein
VPLALQVSKALLGDLFAAKKSGKPLRGMGLCHINGPRPQLPANLTGEIVRDADFQVRKDQLRWLYRWIRLSEQAAFDSESSLQTFETGELLYPLLPRPESKAARYLLSCSCLVATHV